MNLNATLLGQMIAFGLFVWFCWKFVWPPLLTAMEERAKKIEQGLKDSEASAKKIVEAEEESKKMLAKAKSEAKQIMDNAKTQSEKIVEESKSKATEEKERIVGSAQAEIENHMTFYATYGANGAYVKLGVVQVDLNTLENLGTGSKYGNDTLRGISYGAGVEFDIYDNTVGRFEINRIEK